MDNKLNILNKMSGPFVIEKDSDYYGEVGDLLQEYIKFLIQCNVDDKIVNILDKFRDKMLEILRDYYKGDIVKAQSKMTSQIRSICKNDKKSVCSINNCKVFSGYEEMIPFFKARIGDEGNDFDATEMGVIPFDKRTKASTERFSMPGFPCLYIGNTSYVCWLEMGRPGESRFNVSPVIIKNDMNVFDLTISYFDTVFLNEDDTLEFYTEVDEWVYKRMMLMMCSFFQIVEEERVFKSEYIIPQLIMLACKKEGLDGVAYFSTKISNVAFGICGVNVALYSSYPSNRFDRNAKKSSLDEYIEVTDSFNYSIFKQIKIDESKMASNMWIDNCPWIKNIIVSDQQFYYKKTLFYDFDRFLWKRIIDKS